MLKIAQVALVTSDLPGTLRLYSEAFGFRNAGAKCLWGEMSGKMAGLRPDSRYLQWFLIGSRKFFQIEIFAYTCPVSQPLPADWCPCDQGWTRFGLVVPDFDACLTALANHGVRPLTPPVTRAGRRRVAVRDPFCGAIIEVMEGDPRQPEGPIMPYVTNCVADLELARAFYRDALQFEILPLEQLHVLADEALWELQGAERDGFLARLDDMLVEVVQYRNPAGRPKPTNYQVSDVGIMNATIVSTNIKPMEQILERVRAAGREPPHVYNDGKIMAAFTLDPDCVLEYGCVPKDELHLHNFVAADDFMPSGVLFRDHEINQPGGTSGHSRFL